VQVNVPSFICYVWVPIRCTISPIQGFPNLIIQVLPLISHICLCSPHHSHIHPSSLFLVHNSTIIAEHIVRSSLSISLCHDHQLTLCTAHMEYSRQRKQHTLSTAYAKYSIHQRMFVPVHFHYYKFSLECSVSFQLASLHVLLRSANSSVSNRSKFPGRFLVQFWPGTRLLQRVSIQNLLFESQHFFLQLTIGVLIVSRHNLYLEYPVWCPLSSPVLRFAIRPIVVES
jgi:hypothetical protein